MFKFLRVRRRLLADLGFSLMLLSLSLFMFYELPKSIGSEIVNLFIVSYLFLGLSIAFLYLVGDMNPKFASFLHISFFPFASIVFLFTSWLPAVISTLGAFEISLSLGVLLYFLIMVGYLLGQFYIYLKEPKPQEVRELRNLRS